MKLFKKSKKHSSTSSVTSTTPTPATAAANSVANSKETAPNTTEKGSVAEDAGAVALVSNSQKAGLVKRIEQLEELLRVSDEDLANTREALKESREIAKEHNRSSSTVEKARDELEFRCQQLLEKYEEVKEENTKLQVQAEKANTEAQGLRSALEAKEAELAKDKEYFFEQMERWEKKEKTLESQLVTTSEPSSNSAAVSEDHVKIQALNKKISELEGQLVEMTGRAIMDGEVTELEEKIQTLTKELESEKKAHSALQVQYKHLKDDSDVVQALLEDKSAKASQRLREAEAEFDKAAAERQAERDEAFAQTKTLQTKLVDLEVTLKKSQARVLELEKLTKVQKEDFANLEKQRVAALDGKTAALLLAEREKVQVEEERKRAIEIEQVLLDQRQAMEAVIAAVREEERTNINNPHYSPQGSPCTAILSPGESLPAAKSPNTATSQESRSSFFGLFKSQRKKSHVESPAPKAKVDAEIHSPVNQTNATSSSTERVPMKVETKGQDQDDVEKKSAKVTKEEASASSKEDLPEGEPRQLRLEEDNTDNTADVAAASLDYMSL